MSTLGFFSYWLMSSVMRRRPRVGGGAGRLDLGFGRMGMWLWGDLLRGWLLSLGGSGLVNDDSDGSDGRDGSEGRECWGSSRFGVSDGVIGDGA